MANHNILAEVPPISSNDSFVVFERKKISFNFPIHIHKQFEINYIENAKGARRIVGDHVAEIDDLELVLITGSNLEHAWFDHNCTSDSIYEITIQFNPDLFEGGMFSRRQFDFIRKMLDKATHGLAFSRETIVEVQPILKSLAHSSDSFNAAIDFLRLMQGLATDKDSKVLSHEMVSGEVDSYDSRRIKLVMDYMSENYDKEIRLADVAQMVNMSSVSFSRFIKLRTGKSFIDCLNDIRVSATARLLINEPTNSIANIAYRCGFNNISNFNRIFKKRYNFTPNEFRKIYVKKRFVV